MSLVMSVHLSSCNNLITAKRIFMNYDAALRIFFAPINIKEKRMSAIVSNVRYCQILTRIQKFRYSFEKKIPNTVSKLMKIHPLTMEL
jgi:hypothetical protein